MKSVTVHGAGFLGTSIAVSLEKIIGWKIKIYDKNKESSKLWNEWPNLRYMFVDKEEAVKSDLHFVCVPTPMREDGSCYTQIVTSVIVDISSHNKDCDIVIKSTIPPNYTLGASKIHERVFFNPEFLTEENYLEDFQNLPYQFIGNPSTLRSELLYKLYKDAYTQKLLEGGRVIIQVNSTEAEMIKMTRNCYLAVRLSYFNEIKQICDAVGVNYDSLRKNAGLDERVGSHYNKIHSGTFGGTCLPKDINNLITVAQELSINPFTMLGAWKTNLERNQIRDWEKMENRAILKKENNE